MTTYTFPDATGHCGTCDQDMTIPTVVLRLNPNRVDVPDSVNIPNAAYTITFACGHTITYDTDRHKVTDTRHSGAPAVLTFESLTP